MKRVRIVLLLFLPVHLFSQSGTIVVRQPLSSIADSVIIDTTQTSYYFVSENRTPFLTTRKNNFYWSRKFPYVDKEKIVIDVPRKTNFL